jgi:hypothetical protein
MTNAEHSARAQEHRVLYARRTYNSVTVNVPEHTARKFWSELSREQRSAIRAAAQGSGVFRECPISV